MVRSTQPQAPRLRYAPLIRRHVAVDRLEVTRLNGKKYEPARDTTGNPIELPAAAEMPDLIRQVSGPGQYRVAARDPKTRDYITYKDYLLDDGEPEPPQRIPIPRPMAQPMTPHMGFDPGYIALLNDTINNLRDQMRELQSRADRDVRYERERADERVRLIGEKLESETSRFRDEATAAMRDANEAKVENAANKARLEAALDRLADFEARLEEMKAEVEGARELAAELKIKAQDSEFSPLDALLQMDQALDVIGKTAERFKKKD